MSGDRHAPRRPAARRHRPRTRARRPHRQRHDRRRGAGPTRATRGRRPAQPLLGHDARGGDRARRRGSPPVPSGATSPRAARSTTTSPTGCPRCRTDAGGPSSPACSSHPSSCSTSRSSCCWCSSPASTSDGSVTCRPWSSPSVGSSSPRSSPRCSCGPSTTAGGRGRAARHGARPRHLRGRHRARRCAHGGHPTRVAHPHPRRLRGVPLRHAPELGAAVGRRALPGVRHRRRRRPVPRRPPAPTATHRVQPPDPAHRGRPGDRARRRQRDRRGALPGQRRAVPHHRAAAAGERHHPQPHHRRHLPADPRRQPASGPAGRVGAHDVHHGGLVHQRPHHRDQRRTDRRPRAGRRPVPAAAGHRRAFTARSAPPVVPPRRPPSAGRGRRAVRLHRRRVRRAAGRLLPDRHAGGHDHRVPAPPGVHHERQHRADHDQVRHVVRDARSARCGSSPSS